MPAFYPEGDEPKLADPSGRSLHKINNLLKSIDAKTGSTTITGPVTISNEVEVTNSTGNPIPVSGTVGLDSTSLTALENISVTFPATQNVNVTNAGLNVSVSNLPATQPVSIASAPVTPVTDNGGSLTVDGTVTVNDMTSGNAKTKIVDSTGADVSYIPAGTAGTPSSSVLSVQGISGGTSLPVSGSVSVSNFPATQPVSLATAPTTPVTGTFWQATQPVSIASAPVTPVTDNGGSLTVDGTITTTPQQGTTVGSTTFTSTTPSSSVIAASGTRKGLTIYNAGFGDLYICAGATCTTTSFQLKLVSGDYWECPPAQVTLAHAGVYATAGTAYVTTIT